MDDFDLEGESLPAPLAEDYRRPRRGLTLMHLAAFGLGTILGFAACYRMRDYWLPSYLERVPDRGLVSCSANATRIGIALAAYAEEHGDYPASQYDLVPKYLSKLPECPEAGRVSYRTSFWEASATQPRRFLVECCGRHHRNAGVAPDFPSYDSVVGLRVERQWVAR